MRAVAKTRQTSAIRDLTEPYATETAPGLQLETLLEQIESAPDEESREHRAVFLRQLVTTIGVLDNEDPAKLLFAGRRPPALASRWRGAYGPTPARGGAVGGGKGCLIFFHSECRLIAQFLSTPL